MTNPLQEEREARDRLRWLGRARRAKARIDAQRKTAREREVRERARWQTDEQKLWDRYQGVVAREGSSPRARDARLAWAQHYRMLSPRGLA